MTVLRAHEKEAIGKIETKLMNALDINDLSDLPKMDPDVKRTWIKALRSGNFRQGDGYLCSWSAEVGWSFCCLGVLAHYVVTDDFWVPNDNATAYSITDEEDSPNFTVYTLMQYPYDATDLHNEVLERVKLDPQVEDALVSMNDRGVSFEGIADWVEKYL